jgi:hypothetical protein
MRPRCPVDRILRMFGERSPVIEVGDQVEAGPDMVCHADMLGHFLQGIDLDDR